MTEEATPWKDAESDNTNVPSDEQWNEVESEQQLVMDKEGDFFIGTFLGMDPPLSTGIVQGHFTDIQEWPEGAYFMNLPRDLEQKLKKVPERSTVRIEWISSLNTGQKSKMRVFKVQWR